MVKKHDLPQIATLASWFGSNRTLAEHVGTALEGCEWVGIPFAGGMSEVVHITARSLQVNDLHRHLINLAMVAADVGLGPRLYRRLRRSIFHPEVLEAAQQHCRICEQLQPRMPDLGWATSYFICSWMARSAEMGKKKEFDAKLATRWNAGGGDSCKRFRNATTSLIAWRRILGRANFTAIDAFDFLAKCKDQIGHGIYCDPPFPVVGQAYKYTIDDEAQRRLANVVSAFTRTRVVMRFYDVPMIRELYPEELWIWQCREGRTQANLAAAEVLLLNRACCDSTP